MTANSALLAAAAQAAIQDTVVTVVARDGLQTVADVALILTGAFLIVLVLAVLVLMSQIRKLNGTVRRLGNRALERAGPIVERGKGVADNVEFISAAVRTDVERLNATVRSLTDRLQQASDHMEERIDEFNALMEVVQDEAEDIFIDTAATARGVREGVRALGDGPERRLRPGHAAGREPEPAGDRDEVAFTAPAARTPPAAAPVAAGDEEGDGEER